MAHSPAELNASSCDMPMKVELRYLQADSDVESDCTRATPRMPDPQSRRNTSESNALSGAQFSGSTTASGELPTMDFDCASESDHTSTSKCEDTSLNEARKQTTLSLGSRLHGTGMCKPCAFFWKAEGCTNGEQCRHCHLCPQGEIKVRRLKNLEKKKKQSALLEPSQALPVTLPSQGSLAQHLSTAAKMMQQQQEVFERQLENMRSMQMKQMKQMQELHMAQQMQLCAWNQAIFSPVVQSAAATAAVQSSKGSALHSSGTCKPCGWFWKTAGCSNGADCDFCHICTPEDAKLKKKQKMAKLRALHRSSCLNVEVGTTIFL
eukprot:TRINITY_DN572_c0_g1_i2.p1 TRINITY_DN572_c0_g1~~TRINITY_DN572_c0_g1_i2.p1  ORF type:complete len:321 (-),score=67.32 TRINITY_DN572_c0_g1_i2:322-1284(-)